MKNLAYTVISIGGILALLILGKSTLIPLTLGVVLWFLSRYFKNLVNSIPIIQQKAPSWLVSTLVFVIVVFGLSFFAQIITRNIQNLLESGDLYQANVDRVVQLLNAQLDFDLYTQLTEQLKEFNYQSLLSQVADSISTVLGDTVMILIYAAFMFSEEASFGLKFRKLFSSEEDHEQGVEIMKQINHSVSEYIRLKTLVSLMTGGIGLVFLLIMGVEAAFFWAFLIFVLNYIPTIGSLVATAFPAFFSLLQFGKLTPFLIILVGLGAVQLLVGNVVEPRLMGKSLNLSPLVTILALVVWGVIWGIVGMLLSVPITVIMVIIFSHFEGTRKAAILLSETGEVNPKAA